MSEDSHIWEVKVAGWDDVQVIGRFTQEPPAEQLAALLRAFMTTNGMDDYRVVVSRQPLHTTLPPVFQFARHIGFEAGAVPRSHTVAPTLDQIEYRPHTEWPNNNRPSLGVTALGETPEEAARLARHYLAQTQQDGTQAEYARRLGRCEEKRRFVEHELARLTACGNDSLLAQLAVHEQADAEYGV